MENERSETGFQKESNPNETTNRTTPPISTMQGNLPNTPTKLSYAAVVISPAKPKARTPSPGALKPTIKIPAGRLILGKANPVQSEPKTLQQKDTTAPQTTTSKPETTMLSEVERSTVNAAPTAPEAPPVPSDDDLAPITRKQAKKARAKARKALQVEATSTTPTEASENNDAEATREKTPLANPPFHIGTDTVATTQLLPESTEAPPSPTPMPSPPRLTAAVKGKGKINPFAIDFSSKVMKIGRTDTPSNKRKAEDSPPKPSSKKNTNATNPPLQTPKRLTILQTDVTKAPPKDNTNPNQQNESTHGKITAGSWYTMSGEKIVEPIPAAPDTPPRTRPHKRIPIHSPTPLRIQPNVKDLERALEKHLTNIQSYTGTEKQFNEHTMQIQERIVAAGSTKDTFEGVPMQVDEITLDQPKSHSAPHASRTSHISSPQTPTPSARSSLFSHAISHIQPDPPRNFPNLFSGRNRNPFPQTSNHSGDSPRNHPDRLPSASPMSFDSDNLSMIDSEPWEPSGHSRPEAHRRRDKPTPHILSSTYANHRDNSAGPSNPNRNRAPRPFIFNPFSPQPDIDDPLDTDVSDPKETWAPSDIPGILINGVGLQKTAEPPLGWHRPEFKIGPLHHLSDGSKADVARAAPHSIWLLPLRANNRAIDELGTADTIRDLLDLLITSPHRNRRVGTTFMKASANAKQESRFEFPYFILITGITPDQSDLLLSYFCISTPNVTFWTFPLHMPKSHFAGTVAGLHHTEDDIEEVREIITNQLLSNDHSNLDHFVTTNSYPFNESAYRSLIADIHISFVLINHNRNTTHRAWNLILPTNNLNNQDTIAFLKLLNEVKFKTDGFGLGYFLPLNDIPMCEGCKSLGHYYHKCPYLSVEGWMGPKLAAPPTTSQPHNWSEVYELDHDKDTQARSRGNYHQRGNSRARGTHRGGRSGRGRGENRRYR